MCVCVCDNAVCGKVLCDNAACATEMYVTKLCVCACVCVRERESVGGHEAQRGPPEPAQCRKCQACRAKVAVRDSVTLLCVCDKAVCDNAV